MAVILNAKGSSYPSFSIGKNGVTLYQGTATPDNAEGIAGDFYFHINGASSQVFIKQGSSWTEIPTGGDVDGPGSSTDGAIARFSGSTGKVIENSNVTIDGNDTISVNKNSNTIKNAAYTLYNSTTDATQTQLFIDGSSTQVVLQNNTTMNFKIQIAGRKAGGSSNFIATYNGAIIRNGSAATTALLGNVTQEQVVNPNNLDWAVNISADTTNGALEIQVTGDNSTNILWGAVVNTIEVTG